MDHLYKAVRLQVISLHDLGRKAVWCCNDKFLSIDVLQTPQELTDIIDMFNRFGYDTHIVLSVPELINMGKISLIDILFEIFNPFNIDIKSV